ncbi:hypothetical protein EZV62_019816 [Acer yangbiense]|uniref:Ribosome silencing factor n=1 Tax=Acer yangbiense TaxID=1000413 RepID=A0A5C7HBV0_9ROSI|nr:hypothetical protein EZV62_019816 [Acer yangbiense]
MEPPARVRWLNQTSSSPLSDMNEWSTWHIKNIARALAYKAKQKQKDIGAQQLMLPSVQGQEAGKWVVIDYGKVIVHALDEKARDYYNLENLWSSGMSHLEPVQDLENAFVKSLLAMNVAINASISMLDPLVQLLSGIALLLFSYGSVLTP